MVAVKAVVATELAVPTVVAKGVLLPISNHWSSATSLGSANSNSRPERVVGTPAHTLMSGPAVTLGT